MGVTMTTGVFPYFDIYDSATKYEQAKERFMEKYPLSMDSQKRTKIIVTRNYMNFLAANRSSDFIKKDLMELLEKEKLQNALELLQKIEGKVKKGEVVIYSKSEKTGDEKDLLMRSCNNYEILKADLAKKTKYKALSQAKKDLAKDVRVKVRKIKTSDEIVNEMKEHFVCELQPKTLNKIKKYAERALRDKLVTSKR
jgi:hypothetical protein